MLAHGGGNLGEATRSILISCMGASIRITDVKGKKNPTHTSLKFTATLILQLAELGFPLLGTGRMGRSRQRLFLLPLPNFETGF